MFLNVNFIDNTYLLASCVIVFFVKFVKCQIHNFCEYYQDVKSDYRENSEELPPWVWNNYTGLPEKRPITSFSITLISTGFHLSFEASYAIISSQSSIFFLRCGNQDSGTLCNTLVGHHAILLQMSFSESNLYILSQILHLLTSASK